MICVPCGASVTMRLETLMLAKTKHESGVAEVDRISGSQRTLTKLSWSRGSGRKRSNGEINACARRRPYVENQCLERPIPSNRHRAHAPSQPVIFT
ncbi:hypothetical protein BJV78DRAFT_1352601, partial [Lactifluus subvellereus]